MFTGKHLTNQQAMVGVAFPQTPCTSENTLWWPKHIVTNIVFQNCATFNFHQANIKRDFHKLYSK
jgi:hypothetical protein